MKANAPKRKVFQDALDLLRLYEGDRLEDMVQSIREYGVLNPVIGGRLQGAMRCLQGITEPTRRR